MTEEEAKTKWCSMAKRSTGEGESINRSYTGSPDAACRCIASACMMWRFEPDTRKELHGYCGLGGKP
jgi:hypothetical protein